MVGFNYMELTFMRTYSKKLYGGKCREISSKKGIFYEIVVSLICQNCCALLMLMVDDLLHVFSIVMTLPCEDCLREKKTDRTLILQLGF